MTDFWRHIPEIIDPTVFSLGSFSLRWYAVLFLLGWAAAVAFLSWRIRKREFLLGREVLWDVAIGILAGSMIGGRLGYALFYDPSLFVTPLSLVTPIGASGEWAGIRGMSFHGALIGAALGLFCIAKARKIDFWTLADFLVPAVPIALFFGRMGNFFNLELVGRETGKPWGVYFPGHPFLRHPSQLYEAFFEGVVLFLLFSYLRRKSLPNGVLSALFLGTYGLLRFFLEFWREPDVGAAFIFGWMTPGQALSAGMIAISSAIFLWILLRKNAMIGSDT